MDGRPNLKLYNTETRQKEQIIPLDGKKIRMYTCGPTVYNFAHIGNFRTYVFEDLLRRTLRFFGFGVEQAMNLTDIDDKTLKGAIDNQISLDAFTKPFKDAFFQDLQTLGIERVEHYPQATDYVPEMISMIQALIEKGVAYTGQDGSIYFSIHHFPSYGRLSHFSLDELKAGASQRVFADEYDKENVSDFVLWKAYDPERDGQIYWESPFGKGRPGWHIECSAMAMKLLGHSIDIHVGGVDNLFPHHENEIAQSEAYSCCRFVKHWLHAEHLLVNHKKMSKSLGNFYTLRDLLQKGYTGMQVRYMLLQTHYRTQQNFTLEGMQAVVSTLSRLEDFVHRLKQIRREKMQSVLHLILEKALPDLPIQKQVKQRVLFDVQKELDRDILDAESMRPVIERSLYHVEGQHLLAKEIIKNMRMERGKIILMPILLEAFKGVARPELMASSIFKEVQKEQEMDILDPKDLQPILNRSLQGILHPQETISQILEQVKQKRSQGFVLPVLLTTMRQFTEALADDLNISLALAALFDLVREVNVLCDQEQIGISEAEDILDFLEKVNHVLGVIPLHAEEESIPADLQEALQRRELARLAKEWKEADACRDLISSRGYLIEDTPQGARLKKRSV